MFHCQLCLLAENLTPAPSELISMKFPERTVKKVNSGERSFKPALRHKGIARGISLCASIGGGEDKKDTGKGEMRGRGSALRVPAARLPLGGAVITRWRLQL